MEPLLNQTAFLWNETDLDGCRRQIALWRARSCRAASTLREGQTWQSISLLLGGLTRHVCQDGKRVLLRDSVHFPIIDTEAIGTLLLLNETNGWSPGEQEGSMTPVSNIWCRIWSSAAVAANGGLRGDCFMRRPSPVSMSCSSMSQ